MFTVLSIPQLIFFVMNSISGVEHAYMYSVTHVHYATSSLGDLHWWITLALLSDTTFQTQGRSQLTYTLYINYYITNTH